MLNKLSTVILFANPVPFTVIVVPDCVTEVTEIACPIGTDTALLTLPSPLLITTNDPGPVVGASGPLAGKGKLIDVLLNGLTLNSTLPPEQSQNRSTVTPLVTSKPVPPSVTVFPCTTTVSTLLTA